MHIRFWRRVSWFLLVALLLIGCRAAEVSDKRHLPTKLAQEEAPAPTKTLRPTVTPFPTLTPSRNVSPTSLPTAIPSETAVEAHNTLDTQTPP
ncbi:MAG: hypothetical protein J7M05_11460, partial [Anaerolineae bacterium]|nr:hypothetical protein [Anaerolineae bacterium]